MMSYFVTGTLVDALGEMGGPQVIACAKFQMLRVLTVLLPKMPKFSLLTSYISDNRFQ